MILDFRFWFRNLSPDKMQYDSKKWNPFKEIFFGDFMFKIFGKQFEDEWPCKSRFLTISGRALTTTEPMEFFHVGMIFPLYSKN